MARVYVSIGSNVDREANIQQSVAALRERFGHLDLSPVYDSASVGFDGSNFLNLVAGFDTPEPVQAIAAAFRDIEDRQGRDRSLPKFANRSIDLDILLYDDLILDVPGIRVPRPEILVNAFVLRPLQDLASNLLHPGSDQNYGELWREMEPVAPRLDRVDVSL